MARLRVGPPQSERPGLAAGYRRAVGRRQRARRTRQRSGAGLHDLGEGRRLLWLALQLLRPACRCPRLAAAARSGGEGDRARLRAGRAHRLARTVLQHRPSVSARMADGAFIGQHGSWNRNPRAGYKVIFVPFADGKPRAAAGRADRIPQPRRRGPGPAGRRRDRQAGRAAGGRRRRQHGLAGDAGGESAGR